MKGKGDIKGQRKRRRLRDLERMKIDPEFRKKRLEKLRLVYRNRYARRRLIVLARMKAKRKSNPEWVARLKTAAKWHNRVRAHRKRGSVVTLIEAQWKGILAAQEGRCACCKVGFDETCQATLDHIVPMSKGGILSLENTQALCLSCNSSKGDKVADYRTPSAAGAVE